MGLLRYTAQMSLDGYVSDRDGRFDWAEPDEEVHSLINDLEREVGVYLYGRRMYEVMRAWESPDIVAGRPAPVEDYFRIWKAADKIVYSRSLSEVSTARTRLEPSFDPVAVRRVLVDAGRAVSIGGPELAGLALRAGLVDELRLLVYPVVVGGGTAALPADLRIDLRLVEARTVGERGVVYLRYAVG